MGRSMRHSRRRKWGILVSEERAIDGGGLGVNAGGVMLGRRGRMGSGKGWGRRRATRGVSEGITEV
jgi:hypothetical protein